MISFRNNFLFIHLPKTGGNSLQAALEKYSDDEIVSPYASQDGIERFSIRNEKLGVEKHATLGRYREIFGSQVCDQLYTFTVIRNPWDRAMSHYFSPHLANLTWDRARFINVVETMPTLRQFIGEGGNQVGNDSVELDDFVDKIMIFERLQEDFDDVCARLDLPRLKLPFRNVSSKPPYPFHYDDELIQIVAARFADEIAFGGYQFKGTPE